MSASDINSEMPKKVSDEEIENMQNKVFSQFKKLMFFKIKGVVEN